MTILIDSIPCTSDLHLFVESGIKKHGLPDISPSCYNYYVILTGHIPGYMDTGIPSEREELS